MARELGDVLHYFLDEDAEPREATPGSACPMIAAPAHSEDRLRSALLWRLACALSADRGTVRLVATGADDERASWFDPPEGLDVALVESGGPGLGALAEETLRARAERSGNGRSLVLVAVPTERRWAPEDAELLRHCWLTPRYSDGGRAEFLELTERILYVQPEAEIGISILGASDLKTARRAFASFSELHAARFDRELRSQGLVLDELEVYRTLSTHHPSCGLVPGSRAARTLEDVAMLLREDLEPLGERSEPARPCAPSEPGATPGTG